MQLERPRYAPQDNNAIAQADLLGPAPLPPDFTAFRNSLVDNVAATPAAIASQEQQRHAVSTANDAQDRSQNRLSNASLAQDLASKELLVSLKSTENTFIDTLHSLIRRNFVNALRSVVNGTVNGNGEDANLHASTSTSSDSGQNLSDEDEALQPLLMDLRTACRSVEDPFANAEMRQVTANSQDTLLEIRTRLDYLAPFFPSTAVASGSTSIAQASTNLYSMIAIIRRLQSLYKASPSLASSHKLATPLPTPGVETARFSFDSVEEGSIVSEASQEMYSALHKQAKVLQSASLARQESYESSNTVRAVEEAEVELLWGRLGDLLDSTMQGFKLQTPTRSPSVVRRANFEYLFGTTPAMTSEAAAFDAQHGLPEYSSVAPPSYENGHLEDASEAYGDEKDLDPELQPVTNGQARSPSRALVSASDEKMQMDLDRMASAIERLYISAPQLANQRVDPILRNGQNRQQVREMQLAKLGTAIERLCKGRMEDQRASLLQNEVNPFASARSRSKSREQDLKKESLDKLLDEIDRASARTLDSQRACMSTRQQNALAGARRTAHLAAVDFESDREAIEFTEYLLESAGKGRLTSQDASFSSTNGLADSAALKRRSLAQTFDERSSSMNDEKRNRMRSSSVGAASALAKTTGSSIFLNGSNSKPAIKKRFSVSRLLSSGKDSSTQSSVPALRKTCKSTSSNSRPTSAYGPGLAQLIYTVEEMTNLGSMVLQVWEDLPQRLEPHITAEPLSVLLTDSKTVQLNVPDVACTSDEATRMQLTSDAKASLVGDNPLDLIYKADHYEIKIPTAISQQFTRNRDDLEVPVPYSAQDFRTHHPPSLICTSCGAELADLTQIKRYNDLPSEYWAELLDAWMCHPDQTLSKDIIDKGNNIWPQANQALISTTGIILATANTTGWVIAEELEPVHHSDGKWLVAKCKSCRALIGRSSPGPAHDIHEKSAYMRFSKLAIQPSSFMPVASLSSHITASLLETSLARAIHRFIIEDEEEGRNQLILWVFNPYIKLYSNSAAFEGSVPISAAKILYKIGNLADADIVRLIGNAEHETLIYPRGICLQLAELLQTSTSIYPKSHQKLGEWDVGWLERDIGRQH